MRRVTDTNCFVAVALDEPERRWLVSIAGGCDLVAPPVLPYEIGNALSAQARRGRLSPSELIAAWDSATAIPVDLVSMNIRAASVMAGQLGIYAYDAYFLQCAIEQQCPLLTLDRRLRRTAKQVDVQTLEGP